MHLKPQVYVFFFLKNSTDDYLKVECATSWIEQETMTTMNTHQRQDKQGSTCNTSQAPSIFFFYFLIQQQFLGPDWLLWFQVTRQRLPNSQKSKPQLMCLSHLVTLVKLDNLNDQ